jgi:DNA-binding XRE family transcriptional regulator
MSTLGYLNNNYNDLDSININTEIRFLMFFNNTKQKDRTMKLSEARSKKGLNQWDIKLKTGIAQSKLSLIENGYVMPSEDEKDRIASALGVTVGDIDWTIREDDAA